MRAGMLMVGGMAAVMLLAAACAVKAGDGEPGAKGLPATETATFAGGCFWCVEKDLDHLDGVVSTTSGYAGGTLDSPTYEQVSDGGTGHAESVQVVFDPSKVSYERVLDVFWRTIDPTDAGGQFCDRGSQYRTAIFTNGAKQHAAAIASKARLATTKPFAEPIVTEITPLQHFWPAEDYHQDYSVKNPIRYKFYRGSCGRDARVKALWGDEAHAGLKKD